MIYNVSKVLVELFSRFLLLFVAVVKYSDIAQFLGQQSVPSYQKNGMINCPKHGSI